MGLTSALNTSLNGLTLNESSIDVIGNNIANAGTTGFKASTALFTTQLSRTLSVGSRPSGSFGGTNPRQVGMGATTAAIRKDFSQGNVTNSTSPSDLAIQGEGFFMLSGSDGVRYTRNGNFLLNSDNTLVNTQGLKVQGYGIDSNFNLITTGTGDLKIPLGELSVAQQTKNVAVTGALMPTGAAGTHGALLASGALIDNATGLAATATTKLTDLRDNGAQIFFANQTLSFAPQKGGRTQQANTLAVDANTTFDQLRSLIEDTLGIQSGGGIPQDQVQPPPAAAESPGVTITAAGGLQIIGNRGTANDVGIGVGALTTDGSPVPLVFTKSASADGESTTTDFVVYDSLGAPMDVKLTAVMESSDSTGTQFRWYIDSFDSNGSDVAITNGTIKFDGNGKIISGGIGQFALDRSNTAALSPMQITLDLTKIAGVSPESAGSALSISSQDGSAPGTLTSFAISETGEISGVFDNGIMKTLGQITLARFPNTQGLIDAGGGAFSEGIASGSAFITTPGSFGVGTLRAGAIELSNTDVGRSLVDLIVASTNYRGNTRVISSVQQLMDELLVIGR